MLRKTWIECHIGYAQADLALDDALIKKNQELNRNQECNGSKTTFKNVTCKQAACRLGNPNHTPPA
jgi:hypothetical protein